MNEFIYIHIAQYHDCLKGLYSLYSIQRPVSLDRGSDMEALPPKKTWSNLSQINRIDPRQADMWSMVCVRIE